ncbi:hypothetical protein BC830DRAFT_1163073 [Chytriomyces sp. MP71]|nr:hypothetical protein BC830DRAFT_1163073 [Chytriomyces sp. MP71]
MLRLFGPVLARRFASQTRSMTHTGVCIASAMRTIKTKIDPNAPKNAKIPFEVVQTVGPGLKDKSDGPIQLSQAISLAQALRPPHDVVLVDSSRDPPLCRLLLSISEINRAVAAGAVAKKFLSVKSNECGRNLIKKYSHVRIVETGTKSIEHDFLYDEPEGFVYSWGVFPTAEVVEKLRPHEDLILLGAKEDHRLGSRYAPVCKIIDRRKVVAAAELAKRMLPLQKNTNERFKFAKTELDEDEAEVDSEEDEADVKPKQPTAKDHKKEVKDVVLKTSISTNDLAIKIKKCVKHLTKGYGVQLKIDDAFTRLKEPQRVQELIEIIGRGLDDSNIKHEISEMPKGTPKEGEQVVPIKKRSSKLIYMIRAKN